MDELICKKTTQEIREAFFKGKLSKLLDEIQSEGSITEEDGKKLDAYLEMLQAEKEESRVKIDRFEGATKPPDADSLLRITEEEKEKLKKWISESEKTMDTIKKIMAEVRNAIVNNNKLKRGEWLDYGMSVITLMFSVDQFEIVHEQLYRAELTRIIDNHRVSRAEAEERAKLTKEYRQYKLAQRLKENILIFEMSCKKYAGIE